MVGRLKLKRLKESRTDKTVENGITFDFYGPFLKLREEALEEIESCDIKCSLVGGWSRSKIHSLSHGWFNIHSTLLHVPAWPNDFSLFPEFPCHDASGSKGLNYGQNEDVIGSRL